MSRRTAQRRGEESVTFRHALQTLAKHSGESGFIECWGHRVSDLST
jgi:hypothetical protein